MELLICASPSRVRCVLVGLACTCLTLTSSALAANNDAGSKLGRTHLAVDFDLGAPLDAAGTKTGGGGALRVGREFDLVLVSLTPELGVDYHAFGGDNSTRLYSGFIGGRLGIGKLIEPSLFGHVGVGHETGIETRTAPTMAVGLALDLTLLPLIDLGVHAGYNVMAPRDDGSSLRFVTTGVQAALVF